jgi:hypothetical protein
MAAPGKDRGSGGALSRAWTPGLEELLEDLHWPKLLRGVWLALRPERVFVGLLMVVLIELITRIPGLWHGKEWEHVVAATLSPLFGNGWRLGSMIGDYWSRGVALWQEYPWSLGLVKLLSIAVFAFGGCVICRMAACDFSRGVLIGIAEARSFTSRRFGSLLFAVLGPVALAGIIAAGLAVGGWVLLSIPFVNVLGALLYGLFLIAGAVIVVILAAYALGFLLLIPAVACEGSDGIDAIGRAYPYVFSRPLRLVLYAAVAVVTGWVAITLAFAAADAVNWVTQTSATALLAPKAEAIFIGGERAGGGEWAARIVAFWTGLVTMLAWAYAVSYLFCASTLVYLLMRRVCDGQDIAELWMPGVVEEGMAESMRGRAEVAGVRIEAAAVRMGIDEKADDE